MTQHTATVKASSTTRVHRIVLKYDWENHTMELKDNGEMIPGRNIQLKVGDQLQFSSLDGDVEIELEPNTVFQPTTYTGGATPSAPVEVIGEPSAGTICRFWCGIKGIVSPSKHIPSYGGTGEFGG